MNIDATEVRWRDINNYSLSVITKLQNIDDEVLIWYHSSDKVIHCMSVDVFLETHEAIGFLVNA